MSPARSRRLAALCAAVAAVAALPLAGTATDGRPDLDTLDPVRFSFAGAIVERHLVTARDGITTLAVDVIRPDTAERVPAIFLQSPYYNTLGRGYLHEHKVPWGSPAVTPFPQALFPEWYDEYFVPRGYAVVMQDMRGTRNSSGCQMYGAREEATDAVDVISWIAGRTWSNGAVGMTGGSYDGTVAIGAASMAPDALKAIIPIRAIDRWYDYHFFNGVQSAQHLLTPWSFTTLTPPQDVPNSSSDDPQWGLTVAERPACAASLGALVSAQYSAPYQDARSAFWAGRDFLADAASIRAATFIIHGLLDWNVKTTNAAHLWSALPAGTPKKLWWYRGEHADPANPSASRALPFPFPELFVSETHRWFAQFLKGLDAGATDGPAVSVQGNDGIWRGDASWPPPAADRTFFITPGRLTDAPPVPGGPPVTYGDIDESEVVLWSAPLAAPMRIAGESFARIDYTLERGGDTVFAWRLECICGLLRTEVASGYARGAYRADIAARGPSWPETPQPHLPGLAYHIEFPFIPQDVTIPAGARLRLRLRSSDERVVGGGTGDTVTILPGSAIFVPDALAGTAGSARRLASRRAA